MRSCGARGWSAPPPACAPETRRSPSELAGKWLPSSGYAFGDQPGFEVYLDDCSKAPPAELRTEICVPIRT